MAIIQIPIFSTKLFYLLNDIISYILTHSARLAKSSDKSPDILAYISLPRSFDRQSWPWMERKSCYTQTEWGPISQRPIFPPEGLFVPFCSVPSRPFLHIRLFVDTLDSAQTDWFFLLSPSLLWSMEERIASDTKSQIFSLEPWPLTCTAMSAMTYPFHV